MGFACEIGIPFQRINKFQNIRCTLQKQVTVHQPRWMKGPWCPAFLCQSKMKSETIWKLLGCWECFTAASTWCERTSFFQVEFRITKSHKTLRDRGRIDQPTPSLNLLVRPIALVSHVHEYEAAFVGRIVPLQCSLGGFAVANSGFLGTVEQVQQ